MKKKYSYDYPLAAHAVDMVVFTLRKGSLKVLLIKRIDDPFADHWALPGGFVEVGVGHLPDGDQGEDLEEAAVRELREETSLDCGRDKVFLEQLYTFGAPGRDPRGRLITTAYYALISPEAYHRVEPRSDAKEAEWFDVSDVVGETGGMSLAFDHSLILQKAVDRIRGKIDYEPRIVQALLPVEFTSTEFRRVHEIVKGTTYDSSNFSKRFRRMVEDGLFVELEDTQEQRSAGRPARLYMFTNKGATK